MNRQKTSNQTAIATALKSQFHAGLTMLRQAIDSCPDDLWASQAYCNPFWRIAYHTLYFLHLYTRPTMYDFRPWEKHQTCIQDMDDRPSPPDILELTELPHRPPQTGEPYTKGEIIEYWKFCEQMIDDQIDCLDLLNPESGFSWYKVSKLEHQLVTVRHLQHHTAQLMERLRAHSDIGIDWCGARGRKPGGEA